MALRDGDVLLFVRLFVCSLVCCRLKRVLVGQWLTGREPAVSAAGPDRPERWRRGLIASTIQAALTCLISLIL